MGGAGAAVETDDGQRRATVALVMDLAGTGDDASDQLRELAASLVATNGGVIVERLGQSVMLVEFDDAAAAVACAIGVRNTVEARNAELPPDSRVCLRAGVHSGVVSDSDKGPLGEPVEGATKMRLVVQGGGVLLSKAVYAALRVGMSQTIESIGVHTLKGLSQPLEVYAVRGTRVDPARKVQAVPDLDLHKVQDEEHEMEEGNARARRKHLDDIRATLTPPTIELSSKPLEVAARYQVADRSKYSQALTPLRTPKGSFLRFLGWFIAFCGVSTAIYFLGGKQAASIQRGVQAVKLTTTDGALSIFHVGHVFLKAMRGEETPGLPRLHPVDPTKKIDVAVGGQTQDPQQQAQGQPTGQETPQSTGAVPGQAVAQAPGQTAAAPGQTPAAPGAQAVVDGREAAPDPQVLEVFLSKCASDLSFCRATGVGYQKAGALESAARVYDSACTAGDAASCRLLGGLLTTGGPGVQQNPARARELLTKACQQLSDQEACRLLDAPK